MNQYDYYLYLLEAVKTADDSMLEYLYNIIDSIEYNIIKGLED